MISGQNYFNLSSDILPIIPGSFSFNKDTLDIMSDNELTITARDSSGLAMAGIHIFFDEPGILSDTLITDESGKVTLNYSPKYGPTIAVFGKKQNDLFNVFSDTLFVRGATSLPTPEVKITSEIGLIDTLAQTFPAYVEVFSDSSVHLLYRDANQEILIKDSTAFTVTAGKIVFAELRLLKEGYNSYLIKLPAIRAQGRLRCHIKDQNNTDIENIDFKLFKDENLVYSTLSDDKGFAGIPYLMDCGYYQLRIEGYGFSGFDSLILLPYGNLELDLTLYTSPVYTWNGTLIDPNSHLPLPGKIFLYTLASDTLLSDYLVSSDGHFSIDLPEWNYDIYIVSNKRKRIHFSLNLSSDINSDYYLEKSDSLLMIYPDIIQKSSYDKKGLNPTKGSGLYILDDFKLYCDLFSIPYKIEIQSQTHIDTWGDFSAVFFSMGQSGEKIPERLRLGLLQQSLFETPLIIEGGELAYSMQYDINFLENVLHIRKWIEDGSPGNSLLFSDHLFSLNPNILSKEMPHRYNTGEWGDQDLVEALYSEDQAAAWSDYSKYAALISSEKCIYMPFYFQNIQSLNDKFDLLSNSFHWLNISNPAVSESFISKTPAAGTHWESNGQDSLLFDWQFTDTSTNKTNMTLHFFQNKVISSIFVDKSPYYLLFPDHFPRDEPIYTCITYIKNDSLHYSPVEDISITKRYVDIDSILIPQEFEMNLARPNPFNPLTLIPYSIAELSHVKFYVYSLQGQLISQKTIQNVSPGSYQFMWNGLNQASGIYFVKLIIQNPGNNHILFSKTQKIILIK